MITEKCHVKRNFMSSTGSAAAAAGGTIKVRSIGMYSKNNFKITLYMKKSKQKYLQDIPNGGIYTCIMVLNKNQRNPEKEQLW